MTASELHRKLLFYGYDEVTDYLMNSPLNRHVYKLLLDLLSKHQVEVPMVKLFNEIYFQCVRVNYDGNPGMDVNIRYIDECSRWLNSQPAAEVVFATVWAILKNKRIDFLEECFVDQLSPYVKKSDFFYYGEQLRQDLRGITIPDTFPTLTCPVASLPEPPKINEEPGSFVSIIQDVFNEKSSYEVQMDKLREYNKAWKTVTCNYSHAVIEKLLRLYATPADQLKLVDRIEGSFSKKERISQAVFIKDMVGKINTGNFGPDSPTAPQYDNPMGLPPDEYAEYRHNLALNNAVDEEEEESKEEELTRRCEALQRQMEEMRSGHETEIALLEAKHEAELSELKAKLKAGAKPQAKPAKPADKAAQGKPAFLIDEMIEYVKEKYSTSSANEFATMCYRLYLRHGKVVDEATASLLDGIEEAVRIREAQRQVLNIHDPHQVNINSDVDNKYNEQNN